MPAIDTNVLVRWLVDDDPAQVKRVAALFRAIRTQQETLFIPITVVLELEWVLRSRYGLSKSMMLSMFSALLETDDLELQSEEAVEHALHFYRNSKANFAECLHVGLTSANQQAPFHTFDVKAAKLPAAALV